MASQNNVHSALLPAQIPLLGCQDLLEGSLNPKKTGRKETLFQPLSHHPHGKAALHNRGFLSQERTGPRSCVFRLLGGQGGGSAVSSTAGTEPLWAKAMCQN